MKVNFPNFVIQLVAFCVINNNNNSLITAIFVCSSSQIAAQSDPESQRRRAGELCDASPTPRIQQTPLPPSPPITLPPLSPPTRLVLLPLTTGSVPPPPGPYSPPAAWGPLWLRQRGAKVPGKRGTGSG